MFNKDTGSSQHTVDVTEKAEADAKQNSGHYIPQTCSHRFSITVYATPLFLRSL
jgi:hypothetical protein